MVYHVGGVIPGELIVSFKKETSESQMRAILEEYDLKIGTIFNKFHLVAVSCDVGQETTIIERLSQEDEVKSVDQQHVCVAMNALV